MWITSRWYSVNNVIVDPDVVTCRDCPRGKSTNLSYVLGLYSYLCYTFPFICHILSWIFPLNWVGASLLTSLTWRIFSFLLTQVYNQIRRLPFSPSGRTCVLHMVPFPPSKILPQVVSISHLTFSTFWFLRLPWCPRTR